MNQSILNKSRNDKFLFLFGLPPAVKKLALSETLMKSDFNEDKIELSVVSMSVPDISIPSISLGYGGQTYKTSSFSRPDYPALDIKFFLDNGYHNYYILWKWLNLFNDSKYSTSEIANTNTLPHDPSVELINPFSEYITDLSILVLDEYNNTLLKFVYEDAFITNLGGINYSYQDGVEIVGSASFGYNQFHVEFQHNVNKCSINCHDEL